MPILKSPPQRRCINYKRREAKVFAQMEERLCDEFGYTISELHKVSIKEKFNNWISEKTKQAELGLI
tara:strand:+ start:623 stop:823 length:201 start_codon:yes stop_codon:yes gene_type:complete